MSAKSSRTSRNRRSKPQKPTGPVVKPNSSVDHLAQTRGAKSNALQGAIYRLADIIFDSVVPVNQVLPADMQQQIERKIKQSVKEMGVIDGLLDDTFLNEKKNIRGGDLLAGVLFQADKAGRKSAILQLNDWMAGLNGLGKGWCEKLFSDDPCGKTDERYLWVLVDLLPCFKDVNKESLQEHAHDVLMLQANGSYHSVVSKSGPGPQTLVGAMADIKSSSTKLLEVKDQHHQAYVSLQTLYSQLRITERLPSVQKDIETHLYNGPDKVDEVEANLRNDVDLSGSAPIYLNKSLIDANIAISNASKRLEVTEALVIPCVKEHKVATAVKDRIVRARLRCRQAWFGALCARLYETNGEVILTAECPQCLPFTQSEWDRIRTLNELIKQSAPAAPVAPAPAAPVAPAAPAKQGWQSNDFFY